MINDSHIHTSFSADSDTPARLQIEKAIELGMTSVCISDHHDYGAVAEGGLTFLLNIEEYINSLEKLKVEYAGQIELRTGIELGLQLRISDYLKEFDRSFGSRFDFIIGSSHFIDGMDVYYPSYFAGHQEEERYKRYFEISLKRIENLNCFDSFGHLDYVVRYGPNKNRFYNYEKYQDFIEPVLKSLIDRGKALEVNSAGYKYGLDAPNPNSEIIKRYKELGGRLITIGSDAHTPEYLGFEFKRLSELLKSCGFNEYVIYKNRTPVFVTVDDF